MHCHVSPALELRHRTAFPCQTSWGKTESGFPASRPFAGRKRMAGQLCRGRDVPHALVEKKCVPCEADGGALEAMGLCESLSRREAEQLLGQVPGWQVEEKNGELFICRKFRTKNFLKALELASRVAEVAEAEGHHPDIHITGWNKVALHFTTHARKGLTQNDFICAAKVNALQVDDLLSKKSS